MARKTVIGERRQSVQCEVIARHKALYGRSEQSAMSRHGGSCGRSLAR